MSSFCYPGTIWCILYLKLFTPVLLSTHLPFLKVKLYLFFLFSGILYPKNVEISHLDFSCNICNLMVSIWSMLFLDKSFLFFQLCWFDVFRIIRLSGSLSVVYTASKPCHALRLLPGKWSTNSCLWIHTQWKCINSLVW